MVLIVAVLIFGTARMTEKDLCPKGLRLFVAEHARQVYVDPSVETQKRATSEVEKRLVPVLKSETSDTGTGGASCALQILPIVARFADTASLAGLLETIEGEYKDLRGTARHGPWVWRGQSGVANARRILRRRALTSIAPPAMDDASRARCSTSASFPGCQEWIEHGVATGNLSVRSHLQNVVGKSGFELAQGQIAWLDLIKRQPHRTPRLRIALDLRVGKDMSKSVRDLALDEAIGGIDPRRWDVRELAVVISLAKTLDEIAMAARQSRIFVGELGFGTGATSTEEGELHDLLQRLRPIGYVKAFELVGAKAILMPGINSPARDGDYILEDEGWGEVGTWAHFPDEHALYEHEWTLQHGAGPKPRQDYVDRRWHETDSAAPALNDEALREAIRIAELMRPAAWTGGRAATR